MPSLFNVQVTESDIAKAKKNDSYECVVAQAIARTIRDAHRIEVDSQSIRFSLKDRRLIYLTPYAVQGYVIAFDAGDAIEPFSFQLRNPHQARQRRHTPAGRTIHNAAQRARRKARRHTQASVYTSADTQKDTQASVYTSATESDPREAAKAAYTEARALVGNAKAVISDKAGRRPVPRVFKRKSRSYGHRLLRINQERAAETATPQQQ